MSPCVIKLKQPRSNHKRPFVRARHVVAVVAVILISLGVTMFFFSAPTAEADRHALPHASMDILQMHIDHPNRNDHPVQKSHDMTFVFPMVIDRMI
jgi:hypothetical protein